MTTKPKTRKAPAAEPAAPSRAHEEDFKTIERWQPAKNENVFMMEAAEAGEDRIADLRHADELARMKSRVFGLEAAISGAAAFSECEERHGVLQLAFDIAQQMENCAEAFMNMHKLRCARANKSS